MSQLKRMSSMVGHEIVCVVSLTLPLLLIAEPALFDPPVPSTSAHQYDVYAEDDFDEVYGMAVEC